MFATTMDWIIMITVLITLALVIVIIVELYRTADQLKKAEAIVLSTANNLNSVATTVSNDIKKAQPVFDYIEKAACQYLTPKPSFCPT